MAASHTMPLDGHFLSLPPFSEDAGLPHRSAAFRLQMHETTLWRRLISALASSF
jgi:hypothetical protein